MFCDFVFASKDCFSDRASLISFDKIGFNIKHNNKSMKMSGDISWKALATIIVFCVLCKKNQLKLYRQKFENLITDQ